MNAPTPINRIDGSKSQGFTLFFVTFRSIIIPANDDQPRLRHKGRIKSGSEFIATWHKPEFVIEGIFQKRYLYGITAPAGTGKTALAQLLAVSVEYGRKFGDHEVAEGHVLYLAGENPDDIKTRWIALAQKLDIKPNAIDWIEGAFTLTDSEAKKIIADAIAQGKEYSVVFVDTAQAHFPGKDSNSPDQQREYAQSLRKLTGMPGGPAVIALCHPVKNGDKTRPAGGSGFFNEIDANAYLEKKTHNGKPVIRLHPDPEKWRGDRFKPVLLDLIPFDAPDLRDAKDQPVKSVMMEAQGRADFGEIDKPLRPSLSKPLDPKTRTILSAIVAAPNGGITRAELKRKTKIPFSTLDRRTNLLKDMGKITQDEAKMYRAA